jgi:hypothetical protein
MIDLATYVLFLGLLGLVMRLAFKSARGQEGANAAAAMVPARVR